MSSVTVTVSGTPLSDIELSSEELMREVGLLARERIIRRTLSGLDVNDSGFDAYSPGYYKAKQKEVGVASPVNLQLSGGMLNAITIIEVTKNTVSLGFSS